MNQAIIHMKDFLKHMDLAKQGDISTNVELVLSKDANAMIEAWSNK